MISEVVTISQSRLLPFWCENLLISMENPSSKSGKQEKPRRVEEEPEVEEGGEETEGGISDRAEKV